MPAIYALYVINKSGGLIYNKVSKTCTACPADAAVEL